MSKTINLEKSVYEICTEYPEIKDVLAKPAFTTSRSRAC
jgi:hypothetical protein